MSEAKPKNLNKTLKIVLSIILGLLFLCIVVIIIMNNAIKKNKEQLFEVYKTNLSEYYDGMSDIASYNINNDYVTIYVKDTWFDSSYKTKEDFCVAMQYKATIEKNNANLGDGYYVLVYFYDNNSQSVATAHIDGKIEIKK